MTLSPATELCTLGAAECAVIVLTAPLELPDPWDRALNSPDTLALALSKSLRRPTSFLGADLGKTVASACFSLSDDPHLSAAPAPAST